MIKTIIVVLIASFSMLCAQDDFLKGVKAEDLKFGTIVAPTAKDTIGIDDQSKFFYGDSKIVVQPSGDLRAEALTKNRDGIWIVNIKTGEEKQIDDRGYSPKWSPDGHLIAFIKQKVRVGQYWKGHQLYGEDELWVCDANGANKNKLTTHVQVSEFTWSPDGKIICYEGIDSTGQQDEPFYVGIVDIVTKKRRVIDVGGPYTDISFSISPNGKMIAYCKPCKWTLLSEWWVTDAELFIANIDGSGKTQITNTKTVETMVKWCNDGKSLIVEQQGPDPGDFSFPRYIRITLDKK